MNTYRMLVEKMFKVKAMEELGSQQVEIIAVEEYDNTSLVITYKTSDQAQTFIVRNLPECKFAYVEEEDYFEEEQEQQGMNNLMDSLRLEGKNELEKVVKNIEAGNMITIDFYITNLRKQQLENGKITLEKAQQIAIKKATKEIEKRTTKKMEKVRNIYSTIEDMEDINIIVQHKKTNLGYQYKAILATDTIRIEGKYTGGWGYDKLSSAIAEVLNQYQPLMKLMYKYIDDKMFEEGSLTINNHKVLGYGSGYRILPYFESGVGVSSFYKIFDNLGLKLTQVTDEFYRITKK